ncbi:putative cAMP receptor-like protein [Cladophialophora carrionii]|uniref:Putative cAMP receptor-like protein n=1 Tax=Cladophialophora carrionii TaxID=86049 RepID=A0A1C1CHY8_9EURO|nr:putative cAMP receptor-like protein [Cladophialophora carrionii]
MTIAASQHHAIETAERVTSVFSVVGACFIITTFLSDSKFRKPINRLVFYAAWGNLFANVATLIARSGIAAGVTTPLCQFQGFLIHWFLPADALWTFAMACNVYLSFFHQYDASQLRGLEWRYLGACYGIPFLPALVFLFINSGGRGKVYGDAVLWCWVTTKWNVLRIATFYGPVWLIILVTMFIYVKVGIVVFRWRKQLLSLGRSESKQEVPSYGYAMKQFPASPTSPSVSPKTYEVTISSQVPHSPDRKQPQLSSPNTEYHGDASPTHAHHERFPSTQEPGYPETNTQVVIERPQAKMVDANKATLSYCKTAMLFFLALLCTWCVTLIDIGWHGGLTILRVPSTINRVYTLVRPNDSIFGLDFASGLVLPLQGFWNTVIYIVTSLPACRALWAEIIATFMPQAPRPDRTTPTLAISTKHNHRILGSEDTRADIHVSMDGKNRIVNYRHQHDDDIPEETSSPLGPGPGFVHAR